MSHCYYTTSTPLLRYCRDSVSAQFDAFASGLHRVMGGASLRILRAEELELLVAGSQVLLNLCVQTAAVIVYAVQCSW
jgi:HECT-domain (ubiquitin-transferase)